MRRSCNSVRSRPIASRVMMKKKLVAVVVLILTAISFSQTSAQARGHHRKSIHHAVHHSVHHARAIQRRHASRAPRFARHARGARGGGRPAAWCGWWLGNHLGMANRKLWLARNWASVGSNAGQPGVGVVVVWRHHVGVITGRAGSQWIVKSGNDGRAVRERVRSISNAIAFRHVGGGSAGGG